MFVIHMLVPEIRRLVDSLDKIIILVEYLDYINIFLPKFIAKLSKHSNNDLAINLKKDKQPFYSPIYSLGLIKLETLKTYIKIHLANSFIWPSKFFTNTSILLN